MNPLVEEKIKIYPRAARVKFKEIRELIYDVANENELGPLEETLKWGQPAYLCKSASTIRLDWKPETADSLDVFFDCKTILVETFKEVFPEIFGYRGNRVIEIPLNAPIPQDLSVCIFMALNYHRLKTRPLLGA